MLAPGMRIRLLSMPDDPDPIPVGTEGTVTSVSRICLGVEPYDQVSVDWDIPRSMMLVIPPDQVEVI